MFGRRKGRDLEPMPLYLEKLAASSACAFAYGAWMWFGFADDGASLRAQTVVPPFAFGTVTLIAAVSIAAVWTRGQRTAASADLTPTPPTAAMPSAAPTTDRTASNP